MTAKIPLTLEVKDANVAFRDKDLMVSLRKLTLGGYSGMNNEMNNLSWAMIDRTINCRVLLAYSEEKLVAWALLSKEASDFHFASTMEQYDPEYGHLFEVYVDESVRRKGIASELVKLAKELIGEETLCICPWDSTSHRFYNNFKELKSRIL